MEPSKEFTDAMKRTYGDSMTDAVIRILDPIVINQYVQKALKAGFVIPNLDGSTRYDLVDDPIIHTKSDGTIVPYGRENYHSLNFDTYSSRWDIVAEDNQEFSFNMYLAGKTVNYFVLTSYLTEPMHTINREASFNMRT